MPNYYELLGLKRGATTAEVRAAYLRLARDQHPDRFAEPQAKQQAEEAFKTITLAFNTLTNDRARQEYEGELDRPRPTTPAEAAAQAYTQGQQRFEARDYPGAVELLRQAVHNAPEDARYQLALGRALARTPQGMREAVEVLERSTRLAPRDAMAHAELARVLQAQGLRLRAGRSAETAAQLGANDASVRRILAEIGLEPQGGPGPEKAGGGGTLLNRLRGKP
jgi:curved DNA-binding protein CbpA